MNNVSQEHWRIIVFLEYNELTKERFQNFHDEVFIDWYVNLRSSNLTLEHWLEVVAVMLNSDYPCYLYKPNA